MKHIMISIKPEWTAKILNGEKTIEIRKSYPKCELPCKVYIYCTKGKSLYQSFESNEYLEYYFFEHWNETDIKINGKVVAEFTLNKVDEFEVYSDIWLISEEIREERDYIRKNSCLSQAELIGYLGKSYGYAWHIDDLKIYDKPKELSEFKKENKCHYANYEQGCCFENCTFFDLKDCDGKCSKITVAPQSWCYVEGE